MYHAAQASWIVHLFNCSFSSWVIPHMHHHRNDLTNASLKRSQASSSNHHSSS